MPEPKLYEVLVIAVYGRKGRKYKYGEKVSEKSFDEGVADKLVVGGYLKCIGEVSDLKEEEAAELNQAQAPKIEQPVEADIADDHQVAAEIKPAPSVDELTIPEIKKQLKKLNVQFTKNASKQELFDLLVAARDKS